MQNTCAPPLIDAHQDLNVLDNVGIGEEEKSVFLDVTRKIHENLQAGLQELGNAAAGGGGRGGNQ